MPFTENPPPLPPLDVAVVAPEGGLTKPWRDYFQELVRYLARMRSTIP